jgi:hypothetical protein
MRHRNLARLGRAPANCNYRALDRCPDWRQGRSLVREAQKLGDGDRDLADGCGRHGWDRRAAGMRWLGGTRRRKIWFLARELCTSAALHAVRGHGAAARRALCLAGTLLRDRARISKVEETNATAEES